MIRKVDSSLVRSAATVVVVATFFAGCASVQTAHQRGIDAADFGFDAARVAYCDAVTMGAVRRQFGRDIAGLGDYLRACGWYEEQVMAWVNGGAEAYRE